MTEQGEYSSEILDLWLRYKHETGFRELLEQAIKPLQNNRRKWEYTATKNNNRFYSEVNRANDMVLFRDRLTLRAKTTYCMSTADMIYLDRRIHMLHSITKCKAEYAIMLDKYLSYFSPIGRFMKRVASVLQLKSCVGVMTRYTTLIRVQQEGVNEYEALQSQLSNLKEDDIRKRKVIAHTNLILSNQMSELIDRLKDIEKESTELNTFLGMQLKLSTTVTRTLYQAELMINNIYQNLTINRGKPATANTLIEKLSVVIFRWTTLAQSCEALIKEKHVSLGSGDSKYISSPIIRESVDQQPRNTVRQTVRPTVQPSGKNININSNNHTTTRYKSIDDLGKQCNVVANTNPFSINSVVDNLCGDATTNSRNTDNGVGVVWSKSNNRGTLLQRREKQKNYRVDRGEDATTEKRGTFTPQVHGQSASGTFTSQVHGQSISGRFTSVVHEESGKSSKVREGNKCVNAVLESKSHTGISSNIAMLASKRPRPRSANQGSKSGIGLIERKQRQPIIRRKNCWGTNSDGSQARVSLATIADYGSRRSNRNDIVLLRKRMIESEQAKLKPVLELEQSSIFPSIPASIK